MTCLKILKYILFFTILIVSTVSGMSRQYIGSNLKQTLKLHEGMIIPNSDSLKLNNDLLARAIDYDIDYARSVVRLKREFKAHDTLVVNFVPLPTWIDIREGHIGKQAGSKPIVAPVKNLYDYSPNQSAGISNVNLKGAKKFSILSQSGGNSQFSQTLDLTMQGELRPGLFISGSLTDRGYDPAYGTLNSRINELDKLYLSVKSAKFLAEIGNLEIAAKSAFGRSQLKQVSGIITSFSARNGSIFASLARPRGSFESVSLVGVPRKQGPYRILSSGEFGAIVPGSEKVWLNGQLLERGGDKDYVMDYPGGAITFTVRHPIDSRSRIEIDYEPLEDDFERIYYNVGGGLSLADSSVNWSINITHEGDNKDNPEAGELSIDDLAILGSIGDSVNNNTKSGVVADTNGNYVERNNNGTIYYEYVGDGNGDYRVSFKAVSDGSGDYVFEGGDVYIYVGSGNGEYLPLITLPVASSEDYIESSVEIRPYQNVKAAIEIKHSRKDNNLFSSLDDNDNSGRQYTANVLLGNKSGMSKPSDFIYANVDFIDKNYSTYHRRYEPDHIRKFIIPHDLVFGSDELRVKTDGALGIHDAVIARSQFEHMDYDNNFTSSRYSIALTGLSANKVYPHIGYTYINSNLSQQSEGRGDIIEAGLRLNINDKFGFESSMKYDRRKNNYSEENRGTIERQYTAKLFYSGISLDTEIYDEDTLTGNWSDRINRIRTSLDVARKLKGIQTSLYLMNQNYKQDGFSENQLMARVQLAANPTKYNLSVRSSFAISEESRFERGIIYVEVEPGEGQYIFENGQYIPDNEGNYIKLEEIRSNQASVKAGEKSISLVYNPSKLYIRLNSNIKEDLYLDQDWGVSLLLPFYSDGAKDYLFRKLDYHGEVKILPYSGYYAINFSAAYRFENRVLSGNDNQRSDDSYSAQFRQGYNDWLFNQEVTYFGYYNDSNFGLPDNISGFSGRAGVTVKSSKGRINATIGYRRARDASTAESQQSIMEINPVLKLFNGGETSLKVAGYIQTLKNSINASYRLSDSKYGSKGVLWSFRSDYDISSDFRLTITFSGRHSDDRKPRIRGRGEFIAYF